MKKLYICTMNWKIKSILFIFISVVVFSACSKYQRLLKSGDINKKYEMAIKYYEKKDYYKAIQLFDQVLPYYRGTEKAERIAFYYAYCHYHDRDYEMASYLFKNLYSSFPRSQYAEEALYLAAFCQYKLSPKYSLDQSNTIQAIKGFQMFVNTFSTSTKVQECNKYIDEMRAKLEIKAYQIALLYFNTMEYKAAITAFTNVLKDFPDTKYKEQILFHILKSNFYYATKSIDTKKRERFQNAIESYEMFKKSFETSKFIPEAETIYQNTLKEINKLSPKS